MSRSLYQTIADEDFFKARARESISRILSFVNTDRDKLLSLAEVRSLLGPTSESYVGMKTVLISKIVGSEGRYHDFNRRFLPRHRHLRPRWTRVDVAHHQNITLPPIKLYEVGGVYFVRDGNHRVSVGRSQGVEFVDAEVTSLDTEVSLHPGMTREDLSRAVIAYEKRRFYDSTGLARHRPDSDIIFTTTGRYEDLLVHIDCHKYYMNLDQPEEIPYREAMLDWYDTVYLPIVQIIREERLLGAFRGRTESDLYVWVVRHWDELKKRYGNDYPLRYAARDFKSRFGCSLRLRVQSILRRLGLMRSRGSGDGPS